MKKNNMNNSFNNIKSNLQDFEKNNNALSSLSILTYLSEYIEQKIKTLQEVVKNDINNLLLSKEEV